MTDLYDISVGISTRVLGATIAVMEKGAAYFAEQDIDPGDILNLRLAPDMAPFPFQVNSVSHHSLAAAKGLLEGEMGIPPEIPEYDYQGLIGLLKDTLAELKTINADAIAATEGKAVYFRASGFELPFSAENMAMSFSIPNLYFHATTIYDMLRMKGVPLGKMDFLGSMATGLPEA